MATLEHLSDTEGSVIIGWLAPAVLYARFERVESAALAERFSRRLTSLIENRTAVRCFLDFIDVSSYDVRALSINYQALNVNRASFQLITVRPWEAPVVDPDAKRLFESLGCLEVTVAPAEFEERLRKTLPGVDFAGLITTLAAPASSRNAASLGGDAAATVGAVDVPPNPPLGCPYVFDLTDFETGCFTVRRYAMFPAHPRGFWSCVARDDDQALALARRAALLEWAHPKTRHPEDFTVQFRNTPVPPPPRRE